MMLFELINQGANIETVLIFITENPTSVVQLDPQKRTPVLLEVLSNTNPNYSAQDQDQLIKLLISYTQNFITHNQNNPDQGFVVIVNSICLALYFTRLCGSYRLDEALSTDQTIISAEKYLNIAQMKPTPEFTLMQKEQFVIDSLWKNLTAAKINTANALSKMRKFSHALFFYEEAINQIKQTYPNKLFANLLATIGYCNHELNKPEAPIYFARAATIYKKLGTHEQANNNFLVAAEFFEHAKNNFEKANKPEQKAKCAVMAENCNFKAIRRETDTELSCSQQVPNPANVNSSKNRLTNSCS